MRARFPLLLLGLFGLVVLASGTKPLFPGDWWLENLLVGLLLVVLVWDGRRNPLSHGSYVCIFLFLCLHELGAHYSFSNVPYREWFGWSEEGRNHFDRLVHFAYGLLMVWPLRERLIRATGLDSLWGEFFSFNLILSSSAIYELIEWGAVGFFGGDLGKAFLGAQGDEWDAHKDVALAALGALLGLAIPVARRLLGKKRD